jgi:cytoskeletal protein CcmA (bactofilin family)
MKIMISTKYVLSALTLAMVCISSLNAEVMNGGSPNPNQPTLELWLDAGELNNSSTAISLWEDKTMKSGRNASSPSYNTNNQPTYVACNPIFANHPTVSFDGNDLLTSATGSVLGIDGNKDRTIFFVFSQDNSESRARNILGYGAYGTNQLFDVSLPNREIKGHFYGTWFMPLAASQTFNTNQMTVGTVSYDGATFRPYQRDASFGGGLGSVNFNLNTGGGNSLQIGAGIYANYNNYVGDIAEIIVYSEVLTESDRLAVEHYLYTKYSPQAETCYADTPLIFSNTYISTGANAEVYGDILANTYLVAGASTVVEGEIQSGAAVTTGATTDITGNIRAGAAITLGASTVVDGDVCHGAALTLGAGASYNDDDCLFDAMTYTNLDIIAAQDSYNALTAEYLVDRNQLNPTMSVDLTLDPYDDGATITDGTVVYNATSLTSSVGVILTLDGDYDWVFNITDMLSFGAGTKIVMTEGSEGSVTWNVGGYASIGADAETVGTIFANGYISTGLRAKVRGAVSSSVSSDPVQSYCGGLFSATSYVTIGASSTVSCE